MPSPLIDRDVCVRDGIPVIMSYEVTLNTFLYMNKRGDVVLLQVGRTPTATGRGRFLTTPKGCQRDMLEMSRDNPLVQLVFVVVVAFVIDVGTARDTCHIIRYRSLGVLGIAWMIVGLWLFKLWYGWLT